LQIIESHLRTEESGKSDDVDDAVMVAHLVWHFRSHVTLNLIKLSRDIPLSAVRTILCALINLNIHD